MGKILGILIVVSTICLATTPADTTSADEITPSDILPQEQHALTEDTLTSISAKATTPEQPDTGTPRDLMAPPSSKWSELRDQLTKLGLNLDSMSAVGAAFDPVTKNLLIITLEPGGLLAKKEVKTPEWLFTKIIGSETDESQTDIYRQDGRTYFIITTTYRSTGVFPTSLALAMPDVDGRIITGVALFTFGGSLYGSYAFTRNMHLGYGRVAMMNYGGELGVYYPLLASLIASDQDYTDAAEKVAGWGMTFGFPLGIFVGSRVNFVGNYEYGNAAIMRHFGRVGLAYGFTIPLLWAFNTDFENYPTVSAALSMVLIPGGFYLGKVIVGDRSFSSGRSGLIVIAGIMGAATGAIIPTWWESETEELYVAMGLAGSIGGTILGFYYHEPREYKLWQGIFMGVSAAVGTGVGLGIPLIAKADDHRAFTIPAIAGAWGGLLLGELLANKLLENSPRDRREAARIEFPITWEWPSLVFAALAKERDGHKNLMGKACLLRIAF